MKEEKVRIKVRLTEEEKEKLERNSALCGLSQSCLLYTSNQAEELFFRLLKQMAKAESINEQLKVADFMAWVSKMNNIRNQAIETVNSEIIYA